MKLIVIFLIGVIIFSGCVEEKKPLIKVSDSIPVSSLIDSEECVQLKAVLEANKDDNSFICFADTCDNWWCIDS